MLDVQTVGLAPAFIPYPDAWARQREIHADVVSGTRPDTLLLLEHEPVFTAGARTARHERPTDGTPVIDVDRGGKITWHGPVSSSDIPSCACANRSMSWRTCGASRAF